MNHTVYFATLRRNVASGNSPRFSAGLGDQVIYGKAVVSILPRRPIGGENPFFSSRRERQSSDARIESVTLLPQLDDFQKELSAAGGASRLLYVHGYNVNFDGSIAGAARLAHDLGGGVVPITFAWPAVGKYEGYFADENNTHLSGRALADLIQAIARPGSPVPLDLLAHSMGSRVTLYALPAVPPASIRHLVLAAPDVDAMEYRRAVTAGTLAAAGDVTIYVSERDLALQSSRRLHGLGLQSVDVRPRLGQSGQYLQPTPAAATVDVSLTEYSLLSHGYVGTNRAVLTDLFLLLRHNLPPDQRNLYQAQVNGASFYLLRP